MTNQMTDSRLFELIEIWGADSHAWPEQERVPAEALLRAHPERFAEALASARALDAAIGSLPELKPSPALTEAIIAAAQRARPAAKEGRSWFGLKTPWAPASGFAAAAAGLLMGLTMAPAASAADEIDSEVQVLVMSALGFDPANYALEGEE